MLDTYIEVIFLKLYIDHEPGRATNLSKKSTRAETIQYVNQTEARISSEGVR